ncbi:SDR family oxidoreductase [Rhodococcus sp. HNM0569]|uniref:SDR family oxidoreductase n=1 Tax=Rhodococcus sp. HNM0569 TaxID=2716340 RepID=UPI00146A042B|nr:SDR family oxidoreductase [Rhodococcus sp. HNM0569]NLU81808.1 SDR family oxidoreductase [Rhodococcus sp. HNM0569]
MATYLVTGGTGFLGRHFLSALLRRDPDAQVHVLVRQASVARLEQIALGFEARERIRPLVGDLTAPGLGLADPAGSGRLAEVDHVVHLAAIYDLTAGDEQAETNVDGTLAVVALARSLDATLHHVSSIAVAGDHRGEFTENDFDLGQRFPTPYHRTKFEAERLVRDADDLRRRVYRPSVVVGHSGTGEIDKIDGPYFLFPALGALARLPRSLPVAVPDLGATNLVPVDYVADALAALVTSPDLDGRTFHLVADRPQPVREVYSALASAAGAPVAVADLPGALGRAALAPVPIRSVERLRRTALHRLGVPPVLLENMTLPTVFRNDATRAALEPHAITVPAFASYADVLWRYWRTQLDPDRARRPHPDGVLVGRHVVVTGASSGIGKHSAYAIADKGATVLLLARRGAELDDVVTGIRERGGSAFAYPCDLTDDESVVSTVESLLADHGHVDMLVNNAGRSIRRGLYRSTDRLHDFERTMAVNYFGAVRMVLALLPHMRERRFGHIVNISTAGVQARTPRYAAYVASKAALDGFADVAAAETLSDGITFTTIHMPLVQTPMIAPSGNYNAGPVATPDKAAAMVVRALIDKPKRIDVPIGTLGEFGHMFAPKLKDRTLHQMYRAYPDAPAARGEKAPTPDVPDGPEPLTRRHDSTPWTKAARRLGRLVPGAHW